MTGERHLEGRCILLVEDEFYIATDIAQALRGAGASVLGPCSTNEAALAEIEKKRPDAAVVDINLGPGPSFKLAEALRDTGIPFVFVTGYDKEIVPPEFGGVERLEKPVLLREIVRSLTAELGPVS